MDSTLLCVGARYIEHINKEERHVLGFRDGREGPEMTSSMAEGLEHKPHRSDCSLLREGVTLLKLLSVNFRLGAASRLGCK